MIAFKPWIRDINTKIKKEIKVMELKVVSEHEGLQIEVESRSVLGRQNIDYTVRAKDGHDIRYEEKMGFLRPSDFERQMQEFLDKVTDLYGEKDRDDSSDF